MKKLSPLVHCLLIVSAAVAAPTANEDFVIAEDAQTFTNAVNAANAYTDGKIAEIPVPDFSTNNTELVATIEAKAPAPGDYATVSNRAMTALQSFREIDPTVPAWAKSQTQPLPPDYNSVSNKAYGALQRSGGVVEYLQVNLPLAIKKSGGTTLYTYDGVRLSENVKLIYPNTGGRLALESHTPNNITRTATDATLVHTDGGSTTNLITIRQASETLAGLMTAADKNKIDNLADVASSGDYNDLENKPTIPANAADVGAYSAANGTTLAAQVATIGTHLNAEDARFVVTNYNSTTHTPEAYVEIKLPDDSWSLIWSEMTRWDWLFDHFLPSNYYGKAAINAALADKADRAWGFYDSTTGAYAPDGYTWISSEKIAIAANLAYQRTVTTEGAIWVLESNGVVTETGGMTNGFFRISDDEGNSLFEIVKGNKRTVGADASSCQVVAGFTPTKLQIGYSIVADVHPTIYVCESLTTQNWKAETDSDCIANVSWSGTSGAYVAQVQGKSAYSSMFVKATYEVGGETYINNSAPVSMQYIMLNGVKYAVGTATISGNTVLTLTAAP